MTRILSIIALCLSIVTGCFSNAQDCSIQLTAPAGTQSLPRENKIKVTISPESIVKEIEQEKLHLYFFQRNTLEREGLWHFVAKPQDRFDGQFSGTIWLGSETQGRNEQCILKVIISDEKKSYKTGDKLDEVEEKNLPRIKYQARFPLQRGDR